MGGGGFPSFRKILEAGVRLGQGVPIGSIDENRTQKRVASRPFSPLRSEPNPASVQHNEYGQPYRQIDPSKYYNGEGLSWKERQVNIHACLP